MVPLHRTLNSYHDASGYMCGGVVLAVPTAVPQVIQPQLIAVLTTPKTTAEHPIVCRANLPAGIISDLVSWTNPIVKAKNSNIYLEGSINQHVCISDLFDV